MQRLSGFIFLSSLAFVTACSSTSGLDNTKAARQSDSLSLPYNQDFESGVGEWSSVNGDVILASDPTSPSGSAVQMLDRATFGGDTFSPYLPVVGGHTYCVSAKIKWISGAAPFVGIEQSSGNEWLGTRWLFGSAYTDTHGSTQAISSTEPGWQTLSRSVVMPASTTLIRLTDELYADGAKKDGHNLSYVDGLAITSGACPAYTQDWESGAGSWVDKSGQGPTLVSDETSPAGSAVQQLDRATSGGDYFSPLQPVLVGETYCVRAKIKWLSGAAPFVGIEQFSGSTSKGIRWLFGASYTDGQGSTLALSTSLGWQNLATTVLIPEGITQVRLTDELYVNASRGNANLSYVDGLSLSTSCTIYAQDWETGTNGWADKNAQSPTLVNDPTSTAGSTVQRLDRVATGGDFFSTYLPVLGDQAYCVSAKVKWVGGAAPFVGIESFSNEVSLGVDWLFGTPYRDANGSTQWISSSSEWQALSRSVLMPKEATQIRFTNELYTDTYAQYIKSGPHLGYFDGLSIAEGACDWQMKAIAAGGAHACALTSLGGVRCWGENSSGQLGDNSTIRRGSLTASNVLIGVKAVAAGATHTCALMNSGGVRCWGDNSKGQLGDGTTTNRSTPPTSDVLTGVKAVAAGIYHTCALTESGGVRCWGWNTYGQLGDGTTTDRSIPPTNDILVDVKAIAAGDSHTCALMNSGGVRCWGQNYYSQLGDGTAMISSVPSPKDVLTGAKAIAAGTYHTCALMNSGGVRCWGWNLYGQLGDGTTSSRSTPPTSDVLIGVRAVATGGAHTCALMESGGVRCWGYNTFGQLGDNSTVARYTAPTIDSLFITDVQAIAAKSNYSCALVGATDIQCWGTNLGSGSYGQRSWPGSVIEER